MSFQKTISGSFVAGQSQTNAVQLNEMTLVGLSVTGSKISGSLVTFLVSNDGTNFYPLFNSSSAEVTLTVAAAARSYALDPNTFQPWLFVKARLGTSASATLQATATQAIEFIAEYL